jgi:hypothetical protein
MSVPPAWPQVLDFFGTQLVIEPSPGQLSSDAGLLPVRQFDQRIGLTRAFADALDEPRDPDLTEHTFLEMVRMRVYGMLAGYADQNDHDTLRADPVFKLVADRSPDDDDLASQPTLSRFENAVSIPSLKRLRDVFLDQFIASFESRSGWPVLILPQCWSIFGVRPVTARCGCLRSDAAAGFGSYWSMTQAGRLSRRLNGLLMGTQLRRNCLLPVRRQ